MMEHFTAWLTTDTTCLDGDFADVVVLADELRGEPEDRDPWTSTGNPLFQANTNVDARSGDADQATREAEDLLAEAGWTMDGDWEPVPTGCIATVTRA